MFKLGLDSINSTELLEVNSAVLLAKITHFLQINCLTQLRVSCSVTNNLTYLSMRFGVTRLKALQSLQDLPEYLNVVIELLTVDLSA